MLTLISHTLHPEKQLVGAGTLHGTRSESALSWSQIPAQLVMAQHIALHQTLPITQHMGLPQHSYREEQPSEKGWRDAAAEMML